MTQTIVYTSLATLSKGADPESKPSWLDALVEHASAKNKTNNISGVLAYKSGRLIQLIEGGSLDIQTLYAKLLEDKRHENVRPLLNIKDSQRTFLDWGMVLEADIKSSVTFRDFLHVHLGDLVEMTQTESDELLFFVDNLFNISPLIQGSKSPFSN